ncbi:MAG: molybdopterin molybdotransferase MoeA, partial [Anaerolineae bacterium]|nr:molybdopterin molybdotransferase MoeA [Anaerolineae bacterium]
MPEFFNVLPPDEARTLWLAQVTHCAKTETIPACEALGRVTAEEIPSPEALPAFRRSTVDGYAVRAADTFGASASLPAYIRVTGEVLMGQAASMALATGEAAIIHTGGMLPPGADAVVMVEHTQVFEQGEVEIHRPVAPGENVIQVGEDVMPGDVIVPAGCWVQSHDIGALLALGQVDNIPVRRKPRVSIFSTGDELVDPAATDLLPGQVRNINSSTISALCVQAGADARSLGIVPDEAGALYAALSGAFPQSDMLVVTA